MCPHTTTCVLILLCICPYTATYVSSYRYICVLIQGDTGPVELSANNFDDETKGNKAGIYMCPHTAIDLSAYCYMCPHTAMYESSCYVCVLILLCMCPHTAMYVSSYCYICVLVLLYMCPHTAVYAS